MPEKDVHLEAHEKVCSIRYENIQLQLRNIMDSCLENINIGKKNSVDIINILTRESQKDGKESGFKFAFSLIAGSITVAGVVVGIVIALK